MDSMLRVAVGDNTWSPDSGQRPPLANEAAMAAPDSQVISVEAHCRTAESSRVTHFETLVLHSILHISYKVL